MLTFNCHNKKMDKQQLQQKVFFEMQLLRVSNPLNFQLKISLPSPTPWTRCNPSMENCSSVCAFVPAGAVEVSLVFAQLHLCQLQQGPGTFPLCWIHGQPWEHSPGRACSLSLHPRHLQSAPPHSSAAYTHSRDKWKKQTPTLH